MLSELVLVFVLLIFGCYLCGHQLDVDLCVVYSDADLHRHTHKKKKRKEKEEALRGLRRLCKRTRTTLTEDLELEDCQLFLETQGQLPAHQCTGCGEHWIFLKENQAFKDRKQGQQMPPVGVYPG